MWSIWIDKAEIWKKDPPSKDLLDKLRGSLFARIHWNISTISKSEKYKSDCTCLWSLAITRSIFVELSHFSIPWMTGRQFNMVKQILLKWFQAKLKPESRKWESSIENLDCFWKFLLQYQHRKKYPSLSSQAKKRLESWSGTFFMSQMEGL